MSKVNDFLPTASDNGEINYLQTFYHDLVEAAGNIFFVTDDSGYFVYVNSAVESVLGFTSAQLVGTHFTQWIHSAWRDQVVPFYTKQFHDFILETTLEFEVLAADGERHWVEQIVRLIIVDNKIMGCSGLLHDISEQIKAQEAIRHSEEQLRKSLQYQRALNEINFELGDINTFEGVCRRAIELGQSKLGFDRIGLFLFDPKTKTIMGSFGVDIHGHVCDERDLKRPLSEELRWVKSIRDNQRVRVHEDVDLYDNWQVVGHGWNAMALMWKEGNVMGWLVADNLVRQEPLQEYQPELLSLLATSLEHICVQKAAENKIRESNLRYDQLVTNMPGMVYRVRRQPDGTISYEYISPRCKDLTGLEPEAVLAHSNLLRDQIVPEDRVKFDALSQEVLKEGRVFHWEGAVIVNGERRWRRVESRPHRLDDDGMVWDGILFDITDAKRAEEALRQSEERYRTIVEEHAELISQYTPDTKLIFVNESICRYFGKPRQYHIGRGILEDIPPEFHELILEHIEQARITGKPFQYEHPIQMLDGNRRWFEWTDTPIFDTAGKLTKFQSVGRDIDIRKRAEVERNEYINRLEIIRRVDVELTESLNVEHVLQIALNAAVSISQATAGAIHVLEDDKLRVAYVIGNFPASMMGLTLPLDKGIVGRVARRAIPELITDVNLDPDYVPNLIETHAQMTLPLMAQDRLIGVLNVQTAQADIFTRSVFDFINVLAVRIASALDNARLHAITEHHLTEITDLYQQVSELEQLKTQIIRIASHDLRNPLGVISGYVQMLAAEIGPNSTDRQQEQIAAIRDSIDRIDKITRDILTLERISSGRDMDVEPVDLTQMVGEAFNQIQEQAALKQQSYELHKPDVPLYVKANRFLLPETVINLLTNAVKYTPEGGKIKVSLLEHEKRALFTVQDTGYGIPADQQQYLFQPFYRVKTKETRGINGTGLGLHLVKNIIEQHNGQMSFHSEYGHGSTFGFELPLVEAGELGGKRKKPALRNNSSCTNSRSP